MLLLDKQVSIAMMRKDNAGKDLSKLNKEQEKQLATAFGGVTVTDGRGSWVDENKLYQDENYIFKMNYSKKLSKKLIDSLYNAIFSEFKDGGQLAVSVWINQKLIIFDRHDLPEAIKKVLAA